MTTTHFTAWLVNDPTTLDTGCMDITVIEDEAISYQADDDGTETPVWASNGDQMFHAVTTVDAKDGDIDDAKTEVIDLLDAAGWRTVGDWDITDNAYIITVERTAAASETDIAIWSVVRGESPTDRAVEPGLTGVDVPDEILAWAAEHGLSTDDPDVYLLVTPKDEAGEVTGEVAWREAAMDPTDVAKIRAALDA